MTKQREIGVGLIGFGNIGTGLVSALHSNGEVMQQRLGGTSFTMVRIADADIKRRREAPYDPAILTTDALAVIDDPNVEVVVELVGGLEPARSFVERALKAKKHVVTANKAMLATYGSTLWRLAQENGVGLYFEASVGGGIPIIRALQTGLSANRISRVAGILNGTCNYILTSMARDHRDFQSVLAEAQAKGYAEPDPTYDIEGYDTAHKIAILASLAFGQDIRFSDVHVEGITRLTSLDFDYAKELGYVIKLLGIAAMDPEDGRPEVRVHPTLLPKDSLISHVDGVFNSVIVEGDLVGQTLFYGRGAGRAPTASAVLSDLMSLGADISRNTIPADHRLEVRPDHKTLRTISELETHYYLRVGILDRPGVMAKLGTVLGDHNISIQSMIQKGSGDTNRAEVIIVTHLAAERDVQAALTDLDGLDVTMERPFVLRVEAL